MIYSHATEINGLVDYRVGPPIGFDIVGEGDNHIVPSNHPFLNGRSKNVQNITTLTVVDPATSWNVAAAPNPPVVNDVLEFRFTRTSGLIDGSAVNHLAGKWVVQFKDATGAILGGLRSITSAQNVSFAGKLFELVVLGTTTQTISVTGGDFFPTNSTYDYVFTCQVTETHIIINHYRTANSGGSVAGDNAVSRGSVTAPKGTKGPPVSVGFHPACSTSTSTSGAQRMGSDNAGFFGAILAKNEDLARTFYCNTLAITTDGASLSNLPLLSAVATAIPSLDVVHGMFTAAIRDLRRTFKLVPTRAGFPTGLSISEVDFSMEFALTQNAIGSLTGATEMEVFTHYSGTNYTLVEFGSDRGAAKFEVKTNPATGIQYGSLGELEIGIVLRAK